MKNPQGRGSGGANPPNPPSNKVEAANKSSSESSGDTINNEAVDMEVGEDLKVETYNTEDALMNTGRVTEMVSPRKNNEERKLQSPSGPDQSR